MNLIQKLEKLDKLILDRSPIPEQREIIHSMREQLEAHDKESSDHADLKIAHAKLQDEHTKLKRPKGIPKFKFINDQPEANYGVEG